MNLNEVVLYFDALYLSLSSSSTHNLIGQEALGDGYVHQLGYAGQSELFHLAELAGMGSGRTVLDLCCGTGGTSGWFRRHTGVQVTGLDCSSVAVKLGKLNSSTAAPGLNFVQGDIKHLPFLNQSFDAVVCLDGFGAGFTDVFQQCFRILRTGGSLAFLLNVALPSQTTLQTALRSAGFTCIACCPAGESSVTLMQTWLDSYHKHRRAHIREVGRQFHQALTEEMSGLLSQFKQQQVQRLFISAVRDV